MEFLLKGKRPYFFLLLAIIIIYWPITFMVQAIKFDVLDQIFPLQYFISESLNNGFLPLWNPYQFLGNPIHTDPISTAWSPITWFFSLFGTYSIYTMHIQFILYQWIAACGMYKLSKHYHKDTFIAFLLALMFTCSGFFTASGCFLAWVISAAWLPWIIYCFIQLFETKKIKYAILFGASLYLSVVGGYLAVTFILFYILIALGIFLFFHYNYQKEAGKSIWFLAKSIAVSIAVFVVLGLPNHISLIEALPYFDRGGDITLSEVLDNSYPISAYISLIFPMSSTRNVAFFQTDLTMLNSYISLLGLIVLILSFVVKKKKFDWFWIVTGIICLLLSLGEFSYLPLRQLFYYVVPFMDYFRHPSLFRLFVIFSALFLVGNGLKALLSVEDKKVLVHFKRILTLVICTTILISIVVLTTSLYYKTSIFFEQIGFSQIVKRMDFSTAIWLQGFIQLFLLTIFSVIFYQKGISKQLLLLFLFVDLFCATTLQLPYNLVSSYNLSEVQNIINKSPEGFPIPDLTKTIQENKPIYPKKGRNPLVRNTGIFNKTISMDGWHPWFLDGFEQFEYSDDCDDLCQIPYISSTNYSTIKITSFTPNKVAFSVNAFQDDNITVMQNYYPNWRLIVNDNLQEILIRNRTIMSFKVDEGKSNVILEYDSNKIVYGFCISLIGWFLMLVLGIKIFIRKYQFDKKVTK